MRQNVRTVKFAGGAGAKLAATLSEPEATAKAWVLWAHCFTCHRNYKVGVNAARALNQAGFGVMRFDFTGLGESGGDFARTTFSDNVADVKAAAAFLAAEAGAPQVLVGHSLGGLAVMAATPSIAAARCVATVSSASSPQKLLGLFSEEQRAIWRDDPQRVLQVVVSDREMPFTGAFAADLEGHAFETAPAEVGLPLLIFHSPADRTTPFRHAEQLFATAAQPKSFVSLGESDHLVSKREDGEFVGRMIAAWALRYVTPAP